MEKIVGNEYHQWYDSYEEMAILVPELCKRNTHNQASSKACRDPQWLGVQSRDKMRSLVAHGWPAYRNSMNQCIRILNESVSTELASSALTMSRRRKRKRSDYGDTLDIHRVWSGELDRAWERPVKKFTHSFSQKYLTLFVNLTGASMQRSEDGVWRSAVAAVICDVYIRAGYNVEIWAGSVSTRTYGCSKIHKSHYAVRVKEYTQPIHEDRLATVISMPYFRTLGFEMMEAADWDLNYGYGAPGTGMPLPLQERAARGERVIAVDEAWSFGEARVQLTKAISALKMQEEAA